MTAVRRRSPLGIFSGLALVLVAAGGLFVADYLDEVPAPRRVGGNFPINAGATDPRDISSHNSPTLVRNPTEPTNLVIANRIDTPRFSCALHVSDDGGASWTQTPLPVPEGEQPKCYAPDVAFSPDGTMFVSFVTLKGAGNVPNAVWIVSSEDGGRTLSDPVEALGPLAFQVRLVADPVTADRIYLTWLQAEDTATLAFPETGYPVMFKYSSSGGYTWSPEVQVNESSRERVVAPSAAIGPDGTIYVAYLDLLEDELDYHGAHEGQGGPPYPGAWQLVLARTDDLGDSWNESIIEDDLAPIERFVVFLPSFPSLAVDASDGTLYAVFHDARLGDADVYMWASEDEGASFSGPIRVNDTPQRDATSQHLPKVAVAPSGRVDVLYYDRRADLDNVMAETSLQSSFDGGRTFTPRLRMSDRAFSSEIGFGSERDMTDLGSRLALLSTSSRALAVWTDTRAGTEASGKQDLVRQLVAFTDPPELAGLTPEPLRYGAIAVGAVGFLLFLSGLVGKRTVPRDETTASANLSDEDR